MVDQVPLFDSLHFRDDTEDLFGPWFRTIAMDAAGEMLDMMARDMVPEAFFDSQQFLAHIPRKGKARHDLLEGIVQATRLLIIRNASAIRADRSDLLQFSGLRDIMEDTVRELRELTTDPDKLRDAQVFVARFLERLVLRAAQAALEERAPLVADTIGKRFVHVSLREPVVELVADLVDPDSPQQ